MATKKIDLKALRKVQKKSRRKAAEEIGCSKQQIYNWERDDALFPYEYLAKYAKCLGVSKADLEAWWDEQKLDRVKEPKL